MQLIITHREGERDSGVEMEVESKVLQHSKHCRGSQADNRSQSLPLQYCTIGLSYLVLELHKSNKVRLVTPVGLVRIIKLMAPLILDLILKISCNQLPVLQKHP